MAYGTTVINYNGPDKGPIYLSDVGQRNGLGGGRGIHYLGQDRYIKKGQIVTLLSTGDVMLSTSRGVIKKFTDHGLFSVTINPNA